MSNGLLHGASSFVDAVSEDFDRRRQKNPRYSLRAYAAYLGVNASALSRLRRGQAMPSPKTAAKIAKKLQVSADDKRILLRNLLEDRRAREAATLAKALDAPDLRPRPHELDADASASVFNVTAHAIMQLAETDDFRADARWIARRLRRPQDDVESTVRALLRHGLVIKTPDGRMANSNRQITAVNSDATDRVRREHQKAILREAIASVDRDAFADRAHYGVAMSISPDKLPLARKMIVEFLERLSDALESGPRAEVYQFAAQLFPLSFREQN